MYMHFNHCYRATAHLQLNIIIIIITTTTTTTTTTNGFHGQKT